MEQFIDSKSFLKCRLCGVNGFHEIDILENVLPGDSENVIALSKRIFQCVGIRVSYFNRNTLKQNIEKEKYGKP